MAQQDSDRTVATQDRQNTRSQQRALKVNQLALAEWSFQRFMAEHNAKVGA